MNRKFLKTALKPEIIVCIQKEIKDSLKFLRREERTDEVNQLIRELNNYSKYYPVYEETELQVGNISNIPQYKEFKELIIKF